jgi:adenylylsulfate kinase-like enzyme
LNEYIICYTLDNDIIREKIVKDLDFKKEDVMKEVTKRINENKYLIVEGNMGKYKIKSSLIRYIQIL